MELLIGTGYYSRDEGTHTEERDHNYIDKVQKQMGGADGKQQLVLRANQVDIIILIKNHAGAANIIPYHV